MPGQRALGAGGYRCPVRVCLLIPAAGSSRRFNADRGAPRSKLDEDLGGRPLLQRTIEQFVNHPEVGPLIASIVVAGPHDAEAFAEFRTRHADRLGLMGAALCRGGPAHRFETVLAALGHARTLPTWADITHVAVHDAARPCVPADLLDRVFSAAGKHAAVVPAVEVSDTLKRVKDEDADVGERDPIADILGLASADNKTTRRTVESTLDRRDLVAAQTPQVFAKDLFEAAYAQPDLSSTDDSQLVERLIASGRDASVLIVPGDERNLKVTRPGDLRLVRAVLGVRDPEGREAHKRF